MFYFNATALSSNHAVNNQDFHWWVVHEFERHGWTVAALYLGNPMRKEEKYLLINQAFAGKQRMIPFFNRSNNENRILAIQSAGMRRDPNGFEKDKSGEPLAHCNSIAAKARRVRGHRRSRLHSNNTCSNTAPTTRMLSTPLIESEKFPYRKSFTSFYNRTLRKI